MMNLAFINGGTVGYFDRTWRTIPHTIGFHQCFDGDGLLSTFNIRFFEPGCVDSTRKWGFAPTTGPSSEFDEHPCDHLNLVGTMIYVPSEMEKYGCLNHFTRPSSALYPELDIVVKGYATTRGIYGDYNLIANNQVLYPIPGHTVYQLFVVRTHDSSGYHYDSVATTSISCCSYRFSGADSYLTIRYHKLVNEVDPETLEYTDSYITYWFRYIGSLRFLYSSAWYDTQAAAEAASCGTYVTRFNLTTLSDPAWEANTMPPHDALLALCKDLITFDEYDEIDVYGSLADVAVQDAKALDINSIQYLKELTEIAKMFNSLTGVVGNLTLKAAAGTYLAYHYGLRLSVEDTCEIVDATRNSLSNDWTKTWARIRARSGSSFSVNHPVLQGGNVSVINVYKIRYDQMDNGLKTLQKLLDDWDLSINAGNVWDMIPFSFVLDWFVSVGDCLNTYDNVQYMKRLDVLGTTRSRRGEYPLFDSVYFRTLLNLSCPVDGDFHLIHYKRLLSSTVIYPRIGIDTDWSKGNHVTEATALLIQNRP